MVHWADTSYIKAGDPDDSSNYRGITVVLILPTAWPSPTSDLQLWSKSRTDRHPPSAAIGHQKVNKCIHNLYCT